MVDEKTVRSLITMITSDDIDNYELALNIIKTQYSKQMVYILDNAVLKLNGIYNHSVKKWGVRKLQNFWSRYDKIIILLGKIRGKDADTWEDYI